MSKGIHIPTTDAALAQHFTPDNVARFVCEAIWRRSNRLLGERPRIIDPAAGAGVWLNALVESGYARAEDVYGIEVDARLRPQAPGIFHM